MNDSSKTREAMRRFEQARSKLSTGLTMKGGGAAMEAQYGDSYRTLSNVGAMPRLRGKYRR